MEKYNIMGEEYIEPMKFIEFIVDKVINSVEIDGKIFSDDKFRIEVSYNEHLPYATSLITEKDFVFKDDDVHVERFLYLPLIEVMRCTINDKTVTFIAYTCCGLSTRHYTLTLK
jgi:hypothetical protein